MVNNKLFKNNTVYIMPFTRYRSCTFEDCKVWHLGGYTESCYYSGCRILGVTSRSDIVIGGK